MLDLQTISDRIEIDDLITTYTRAVDTLDWDRFDTVFTPDATIDYTASGGLKGTRDEVRDWLAATLPMFSNMQHYVAQKEVRIDGDTADVRVYLMNPMQIEQPDGSKWHMDVGGYYLHKLVRTPDGWRSRELVEELAWDRKPH
ncbi:MAG: nuclear transport factor 2 family protein [Aeromicrobium sp.]